MHSQNEPIHTRIIHEEEFIPLFKLQALNRVIPNTGSSYEIALRSKPDGISHTSTPPVQLFELNSTSLIKSVVGERCIRQ